MSEASPEAWLSERSGAAGTSGARMEEGVNINKSLATLGRCINALAQRESPPPTAKAAPARTPAKSPAAGKAAAGKAAVPGLANPEGKYNCFLNTVVQAAWPRPRLATF